MIKSVQGKKATWPRPYCPKCGSVNILKHERKGGKVGRCLACRHRGPSDEFRGQAYIDPPDGRMREQGWVKPVKGADEQ